MRFSAKFAFCLSSRAIVSHSRSPCLRRVPRPKRPTTRNRPLSHRREMKAWDIDVGPDGKGLPPGSGTAKDGAKIFAEKCAPCHTPTAEGGKQGPALVGGAGTLKSTSSRPDGRQLLAVSHHVWDYIHRAMPRGQGGSLDPDEVYSLTAFLLYRNGIVKEDDVLDARRLPKIQMPNRNSFIPENLNEIWEHNKRACHTGTCP